MTLVHLCLSSRASQLLRWQQAFPEGRIVAGPDRLNGQHTGKLIVWLHADCYPRETLYSWIGELAARKEDHRIVVMSSVPNVQETATTLAAGAGGYCHALATPELYRKIATVVANGGFWVGSDFLNQLVGGFSLAVPASPSPSPLHLDKLSVRERDVVEQVQKGASNKEIADALDITERTVKAHLGSIFQKLDVRDRLQLILLLSQTLP